MRNRTLDIVKAWCIIFVILNHIVTTETWLAIGAPFWARMAVPMFMVISGYVYTRSFLQRGNMNLGEMYKWRSVLKRILRFLIPYTIYFILAEIIIRRIFNMNQLVADFLTGQPGAGTFYTPVMIQFVIFIPVIITSVCKLKFKGVILWGVVNMVFEIIKTPYGISGETYRLLVLRYVFIISVGVYLALEEVHINKILMICCFLFGALFIYFADYRGATFSFSEYWTDTSMFACLYIVPVATFLIRKCHFKFRPLEVVGQRTYDIFLAQGLFFVLCGKKIIPNIPNKIEMFIMALLFSFAVGLLFYYIENTLYRMISRKIGE